MAETKRSVLITGGAGNIATRFAEMHPLRYALTLLDLPGQFSDSHAKLGRLVEADIVDLESMAGAFDGVDTVIHLGGERRPGTPWSQLLPANIIGTYNVVVAAIAARCRRVVYASSVHTVTGHGVINDLDEYAPVRPGDLYGVTKCFGEALGAFASLEDISFIALRIGAFDNPEKLLDPANGWMLRDYCHPEDLFSIMRAAIEEPDIQFAIYNAVSENGVSRLSMARAREELGYRSRADSFEVARWFSDGEHASGVLADKTFESGFRDDLALLRSKVRP